MFANQIRCTVVFCAQLSTLTTEIPCVFRGSTCSTLVYWEASQGFPRGVGTCWFNTNLAALLRIQLVSSQHDIGKNAGWGKTCVKYCQVIHYYVTIWFYILHIIRIHQLYIYMCIYMYILWFLPRRLKNDLNDIFKGRKSFWVMRIYFEKPRYRNGHWLISCHFAAKAILVIVVE